jgi:GNAT superfamily N-acetyltransferase
VSIEEVDLERGGRSFSWTEDGSPVGWVFVRERELPYGAKSAKRYAEIVHLEVAMSHRGTGVATNLLNAARHWVKEQGFDGLCVDSGKPGSPGYEFYRSYGCTIAAVTWDVPL